MKKKRNGAYQKLDNPSIEFIKKEVMDYKKSQNLASKTLGIYKRVECQQFIRHFSCVNF